MKPIVVIISLLLFAVEAYPCSCENPPSILQAYNGAELVISGKVKGLKVIPLSESIREIPVGSSATLSALRPTEENVIKADIEITKVYKGIALDEMVTIFTPASGATCGYVFFEIGQEFIIYGYQRSFLFNTFVKAARGLEIPNTYWTNQCSRTHPFSQIEADNLQQIQNAQKTYFLPRFGKIDHREVLKYFYKNKISVTGEQTNDLQAAQLLNKHLEIIDSEFYIDVELVIDKEEISSLRFYAKEHSTHSFSNPLSSIQVKYIGLPNEKNIYLSLSLQEKKGKKLVFQCSKYSDKIILSHYKDDLPFGRYMEFDTFGALRIQGNYQHENVEFVQTTIEYDSLTFEEIRVVQKYSKTPKKSGQWMFFDIYGNLEKVKDY